jgi:haloalkane dehalogenase
VTEPALAPHDHLVKTPKGNVFVREIPGDDPPIVLMHGFPDDHSIYDRLLPLLSPRRAAAFDWRGYGRSGRAELGGFSLQEHAAELEALLDQLDIDRAVLVGASHWPQHDQPQLVADLLAAIASTRSQR